MNLILEYFKKNISVLQVGLICKGEDQKPVKRLAQRIFLKKKEEEELGS